MNEQKEGGFTLVEILVAVSIIFVLAALIFAALGPVRENGRGAVCVSNLHQFGRAFQMYIADWDGVDPVKGVRMNHTQLGLPPESYVVGFEKAYKLWGTGVLFCPSAHYPPSESWVKARRGSSYILSGFYSDDSIIETVARCGPDYPLVICEMHNADVDFTNQPTWATKRVQVVRINQRVESLVIPARAGVTGVCNTR